jgi:photosystem II stability/assembly factor-like uncharacterized protein
VFKSTNAGGTWSAVFTSAINTYVRALAIDPLTPATLYAGQIASADDGGGGVFKSVDGGGNWSAVNTGLSRRNVRVLAIDPLAPATLYVGVYAGYLNGVVYKSTNAGGNWVDTGLTDTFVKSAYSLAIDPATPNNLYAGTENGVFAIQQIPATPTETPMATPTVSPHSLYLPLILRSFIP